ncbi:Gibberellin regulated protein [Musa troglodytarum]|uniref:Gibberellin regulated protein n=1 Tax=Musa troglodytarum TaxID=320322 RepID=A0A9E7G2R5_9LILI|nr:Gibberellin regulated protein [Musa troglodytarum]
MRVQVQSEMRQGRRDGSVPAPLRGAARSASVCLRGPTGTRMSALATGTRSPRARTGSPNAHEPESPAVAVTISIY